MECSALSVVLEGFEGPAGAQSIAAHISRLVARGVLTPGQRLPTVRRTASAFSVSATTIGEVWQTLGRSGVIETGGRRGTFVRAAAVDQAPRFWHLYPPEIGDQGIDLSEGVPDPRLLPDLTPFLASLTSPSTSSYLDAPVLPHLDTILRERWPFEPEALTVVDGALDALDRLVSQLVRPGMRVLVEEPGFPPLYDILELAGAEVVGLPIDSEGVVPEPLEAALKQFASVIVLQPGEHNPTGFRLSERRSTELSQILAGSGTIIIEDDHRPFDDGVSLGLRLPGQTVHIRSFSKTHGPEIRLAAVGGAGAPIRELVRRRQLGPGWSSRLLQELLANLLESERVKADIANAQRTYAERRVAITQVLDQRGVSYARGEGMNLWIEVADERSALVALASQGIVVAPGGPFVLSNQTNHVRVTVGTVDKDHTELAHSLADAALRRGRADV
ncbi:MAG: aminotransferase class I/II-fold pyridoxal phosphate-dependent enzyme [Acidimicrobiales bacterium]